MSATRRLLCPSSLPNTQPLPCASMDSLKLPQPSPQTSQILNASSHSKINSFKKLK